MHPAVCLLFAAREHQLIMGCAADGCSHQAGSMPSRGQREGRMLPTLPTEGPRPPVISMAWLSMRKAMMSFQS